MEWGMDCREVLVMLKKERSSFVFVDPCFQFYSLVNNIHTLTVRSVYLILSHLSSIEQQFDKYFAANAVKNGGGSFYLQSKVYRAKELLDEYQAEHAANEQEDRQAEAENQAASDQRQKEQQQK